MERKRRARLFGWMLVAALLAALFCLIYPVYVIRPFRAQGPRELQAALAVMRVRPTVFGMTVAIAIGSAVVYGAAAARRWRVVLAALGAVAVAGIAALSTINIYEKMFHPMPALAFDTARDTRLDGAEKVITVAVGGEARAYPIRSMSYHHVVNDTVGGVAIIATY